MTERYTAAEIERIAEACYTARHTYDASGPWSSLPTDRRWFWRRAALAAVVEAHRVDTERRDRWRGSRRRTVQLAS